MDAIEAARLQAETIYQDAIAIGENPEDLLEFVKNEVEEEK